jgi:hypothetical protein
MQFKTAPQGPLRPLSTDLTHNERDVLRLARMDPDLMDVLAPRLQGPAVPLLTFFVR